MRVCMSRNIIITITTSTCSIFYLFLFVIMLHIIFTFLLWLLCVNGFAPLRKHHSHLESPIDETNVIKNMSHLYTTDDSICGEASLSCMAFGASIPIRCGILTKAPLCRRLDSTTKRVKCDTFCDTDGYN